MRKLPLVLLLALAGGCIGYDLDRSIRRCERVRGIVARKEVWIDAEGKERCDVYIKSDRREIVKQWAGENAREIDKKYQVGDNIDFINYPW